ncbi:MULTISPECIES: hypothetical protein [Nostocales]|uniref:DUF5132 domain-containing protein n=3 Tax=Nostocales TaxID=1161 RepID=A0A0C1R627_9CYAN|nr:hypothetical protein [Tolypothrix bouteillei]KAF3888044.1 DUF5132 domain-containing protein [Tolypothrix bouteillei VB521301]
MEWEALLLGIEPLTAIAVGLGAVVLAPVISSVGSALGQDGEKLTESITESTRELTKKGLVWGFEAVENAQVVFAQAEESFRDLIADAKVEHVQRKTVSEKVEPQHVEIVSE